MFKGLRLVLFVLLSGTYAFAQYEQIWAFGDGTGLDFNSGVPVTVATAIKSGEAGASVCGRDGSLLFYTDGQTVWNRNNLAMPNGKGLTLAGHGTQSTSQGALIVPDPADTGAYYVFSLSDNSSGGVLTYSRIDMRLQGGYGDVMPLVRTVSVAGHLTEHMAAVMGAGCAVWVLVISREDTAMLRRDGEMKMLAYKVDYSGVRVQAVESRISAVSHTTFQPKWVGCIAPAPDGSKVAVAGGGLWVYDFDPVTGRVSNRQELAPVPRRPTETPFFDSGYYYAPCFSSDGRMLYGSTNRRIFQFDLTAGSYGQILQSRYTVCDTTQLIRYGSGLKRGPDRKIYAAHHDHPNLSVIHTPDASGAACGFVKDEVSLSGASGVGMPNTVVMPPSDTVSGQPKAAGVPCFGSHYSAVLDAAAVNIVWFDGDTSRVRDFTENGNYGVMYSVAPCLRQRVTDTFLVRFSARYPEVIVSPACRNAADGSISIRTRPGDEAQYRYVWLDDKNHIAGEGPELSGKQSGRYMLAVSTSDCADTITVELHESPYRASFNSDSFVCSGLPVQFRNTSDPYFRSFSWDFGTRDGSMEQHPQYMYSATGTFLIRLIASGDRCTDTLYRELTVDAPSDARFVKERDSICLGAPVSFEPLAGGAGQLFQWDMGDGHRYAVSGRLTHAYEEPGFKEVTLMVESRACPGVSWSDTVYVETLPQVYLRKEYIGPDSGLCLNGGVLMLENEADNASLHTVQIWNTGAASGALAVKEKGMYILEVRTLPLGCVAADSVHVVEDCAAGIPNAFIPDGDGVNDYFFPKLMHPQLVKNFSMKVFNRWGEVVFETDDPGHRGWDGRQNGRPQISGVYVYTIRMVLRDETLRRYQGNVTLLR